MRLRCRLGFHFWQYLLAPPIWPADGYKPGLWCIFCARRHPTWRQPLQPKETK